VKESVKWCRGSHGGRKCDRSMWICLVCMKSDSNMG
jgi:hypothetical protein